MRKHTNFGFSSILLTFVMICLITFSVLALITSHSDYTLSQKVAAKNSAYYSAEEQAYDTLSAIDAVLWDTYSNSSDRESYLQNSVTALSNQFDGTWETLEDEYVFTYTEVMSEDQALIVSIALTYPSNDMDSFYHIKQWRSTSNVPVFEEEPLHLIGNE